MADNSNLIVNALQATDPGLYNRIDAGNSWKAFIKKKGARVNKYRKYERGDHDANLTTNMRNMLRLKDDDADLEELNDNYCRIIVDKMGSRVTVSEINTDKDEQQKWIDAVLEENSWDAIEGEVNRGAIRDGDGYILVDPVTLKWSVEPAYDGFSGMVAIHDPLERKPIWACKLWSEAEQADDNESVSMKIVVYQPGQISYFSGAQGGLELRPTEEPREWTGEIPLVHFVNQKDSYTDFGESEIRPAIPLQNVLNRTIYSMVIASEMSAFKTYYSVGMEFDKDGIVPGSVLNMVLKDAEGNPITEFTQEQVEFLKAVKVGEFNESNLSNYTEQIDKVVAEISQATQTPIYGITTQGVLSGDALKQLESGLVGKVQRYQRENADAIVRLFKLTAAIQDNYQTESDLPNVSEIESISVNWKDPQIVDVSGQIAVLVEMRSKAPGLWPDEWYRKQIGGLLQMTQSQIQEEGENAQNMQSLNFEALVGGGGGAPVV